MSQNVPILALFGMALALAMGSMGYALAGGPGPSFAMATSIAAVALAEIILAWMLFRNSSWLAQRLARSEKAHKEMHKQLTGLAERASLALRQPAPQAAIAGPARQPSQQSGFEAVHHTAQLPPAQPATPWGWAVPPVQDFSGQLAFALEPVIDIPTQRTAHYRLHPLMMLAEGELMGEALLRRAADTGFREELDFLSVSEALGLLRQLHVRDPALCVLVPIGLETLRKPDVVARICECCDLAQGEAQGLILEMPHVALAAVSGAALDGLAALARRGLGFGLNNIAVSGLDFEAMRQLNIRFAGVNANIIGPDGPPAAAVNFGQIARISRINVYVTDIRNPSVVAQLASVARLACGPCFAMPRRVRRVLDGAPLDRDAFLAA